MSEGVAAITRTTKNKASNTTEHPQLITSELSEKVNAKILSQNHKPGLYIVATPIGNMFDLSFRALWILKNATCVFSEDTRQSRKLLDWYGVNTKVVSCHEYNETDFSVISQLNHTGIFALISDAGTPAISDPGYRLVNWCLRNGVDVFPIPGASAVITAISASGIPSDRFTFVGFPPAKEKARRDFLRNLKDESGTLVFYESPNRLRSCLADMLEIFGNRCCCVCREITKIFEEFKRGTLAENLRYFEEHKPIGEFVILVSKSKEERNAESIAEISDDISGTENTGDKIFAEMDSEIKKLLGEKSVKESVKILAEKYGKYDIGRNKIYKRALELNKLREDQDI